MFPIVLQKIQYLASQRLNYDGNDDQGDFDHSLKSSKITSRVPVWIEKTETNIYIVQSLN